MYTSTQRPIEPKMKRAKKKPLPSQRPKQVSKDLAFVTRLYNLMWDLKAVIERNKK